MHIFYHYFILLGRLPDMESNNAFPQTSSLGTNVYSQIASVSQLRFAGNKLKKKKLFEIQINDFEIKPYNHNHTVHHREK